MFSLLPLEDAGLHLVDGAFIQGDGSYKAFVSYIAKLYGTGDTHPTYFVTEEEWQTSVTMTGVCGKFVYNPENNTVRLPKVTGFVEGTLDANALGELVQAGLPALNLSLDSAGAHTHTRGTMDITGSFRTGARGIFAASSGAISRGSDNASDWGGSGSQNLPKTINFKASNSWTGSTSSNGSHTHNINVGNPIFGANSTVQPQAIKGFLYIVIANSTKTDIEVDIDNVMTDLNSKMDKDYSNATIAPLLQNKLTNCILETPQRVKFTLENGVLTILAGSVFIVPYGTSAPMMNIGDSFPTADYKIVDIQYSNNQLFYWVELLVNKELETINATHECYVCLIIEDTDDNEEIPGNITAYYVSAGSSSATNDDGGLHYNTASNFVDFRGSDKYSFPSMIVDYNSNQELTGVETTFNGIGFIGSTIFVDKGVKGLMTNHKNPDGTFNSISYETPELLVWNQQIPVSTNHEIILKNDGTFARCPEYVVKPNGYLAQSDILTQNLTAFSIGYISTNDKSIISMKPKQVFQAADVQDIDGAWVGVNKTLVNNQTYPTSKDTVIDLSDILPKNDNIYECLFEANAITGATSGNYLNVIIKSSALNNGISIISCRTRTNSTMQCNGNVLYPVGSDKTLTIPHNSSYVGNYSLFIKGYRKVR